MANLTTQVRDLLVNHDIDLLRVDSALGKQVDGILNGLSDKLRDRVIKSDVVNARPVIQNKKLNQLVVIGAQDIKRAYQLMTDTVVGELSDLAVLEGATVTDTLNRAMRVDLASNQVHLAKLKAMAGNTMLEGAPIKEWWSKQTLAIADAFKNHIREGMLTGEGIEKMVQRIHGTRANKYADGLIRGPARHAAKRLVRSSVLAVANNARMETFKENSDVIKGVQWVSTLDSRTSDLCMALDGQSWTLDGRRMRGTTQSWQGPPPAHWNCRSTLIPVTRTFSELARNKEVKKKLRRASNATKNRFRAAADGRIAAKTNYEGWLKRQPTDKQREILGKTKHELWTAGKITLTDLVDQSGNPRTVAQLLAKFNAQKFVEPAVIKPTELSPDKVAAKRKGVKPDDIKFSKVAETLDGREIPAAQLNKLTALGRQKTQRLFDEFSDDVKYSSPEVQEAINKGSALRRLNSAYLYDNAGLEADGVKTLIAKARIDADALATKTREVTPWSKDVARMVEDIVDDLPSYCRIVEGGTADCHSASREVVKRLSKRGYWRADDEIISWGDSGFTSTAQKLEPEVMKILKEEKAWLVWRDKNKIISDMLSDLDDGTLNGHSFIKFGGNYIDPFLSTQGVPQELVNEVGRYLEDVAKRAKAVLVKSAGANLDINEVVDYIRAYDASTDKAAEKLVPVMGRLREHLLTLKAKQAKAKFDDWFKGLSKTPGAKRSERFFYEVYSMVGEQRGFKKVVSRDRGYANPFSSTLNIGGVGRRAKVTFHEYGHFVEFNFGAVNRAAEQFVSKRSYGTTRYKLKKMYPTSNYAANETAFVGDFTSGYIGKTYPGYYRHGVATTEVISMGLEAFSTPRAMANMFLKDNELFELIVGVMHTV